MGAGIAQVAAEAGLEVRLLDPVSGAYERALDRIGGFLERKVAKGQLAAGDADAALRRITEAGSVADLAASDLVVEAIPEDLDLKRDAFRRLDAAAAVGPSWPLILRPCRCARLPWRRHAPIAWWACISSTRSRSWPWSR